MSKKKVSRATIKMYFSCFQNIKSFSGISGKGQVTILENMEAVGKLVDEFTRAEERRIKTLQTPAVKQASEIVHSMNKPDLSDKDKETLKINLAIIDEAERELDKFKEEYFSAEVNMPSMVKISNDDFYVLAEKNSIDPMSDEKVGLFPTGIAILKELLY